MLEAARSQAIGPRQDSSQSSQRTPSGVDTTLPRCASPWSAWTGRSGRSRRSRSSSRSRRVLREVRGARTSASRPISSTGPTWRSGPSKLAAILMEHAATYEPATAGSARSSMISRWRQSVIARPVAPTCGPGSMPSAGGETGRPRSARKPASARLSAAASGPRTRPGADLDPGDDRRRPQPDEQVQAVLQDDRVVDLEPEAARPTATASGDELAPAAGAPSLDAATPSALPAEEDLDDVAVADAVGLALRAEPAGLARLGHRAERQQVVVRDGLGPDEALREVGVDRAGRIDRRRAVADRPGPDLVRAGGQERDQPEQPVRQRR